MACVGLQSVIVVFPNRTYSLGVSMYCILIYIKKLIEIQIFSLHCMVKTISFLLFSIHRHLIDIKNVFFSKMPHRPYKHNFYHHQLKQCLRNRGFDREHLYTNTHFLRKTLNILKKYIFFILTNLFILISDS